MSRALEAPLEDSEVLVGNKGAQRKKERKDRGRKDGEEEGRK